MDKASTSSGCDKEGSMQQLLPSVKDPKLWLVKCKRGSEQKLAVCMMRKFITKPAEVKICSVTALDHLEGYIYIEAYKLAHVMEACRGISDIYTENTNPVPIEEMAETISVKVKAGFSQDSLVRMKSGIYKGDLAKVVDVDNVRQSVMVKLIPRIDLQVVSGKVKCGPGRKQKAVLPPPCLLNVEEAREMHIRVERKQDPITGTWFEHIKGMKFKDGFLYKTVSANSISNQNIQPTFDELQTFQQPGESGDGDVSTKKGQFMEGDMVIVVQGEAKNSIGTVERVEEDILHVTLKNKLYGTVPVNVKDVSKYFEPGFRVKVVSGAKKGATGFVMKTGVDGLIILSDTMKEEMLVSTENIVQSTEVASDVPSGVGGYELKDLVLLDKKKGFGVIIELGKEEIKVLKCLKERQEIVRARITDIKCKLKSKTALDHLKNKILVNDVVRILDGPCKGQEGSVEHIYKGILFINDRYHHENAGIVCAGSQSCKFVRGSCGGDSGASTSTNQHHVAETPRVLSRGGPPSGES